MAQQSPTLRRRLLGGELKAARIAKGMTREQVAEHLGYAVSTLFRIEAGTTSIKKGDLFLLFDLYGIADAADRDRLEQLRADGRKQGWWSAHYQNLGPHLRRFIGLEDAAVTRLDYTCLHLPGLLQTEGYARAAYEDAIPALPPSTVDERVVVRMKRQDLITREVDPLRLHAILDEACIRRRIGGKDVWREQLEHLLETGRRYNITIQVLPFAAGAPASGAPVFILLQFAEGPDIAYVDLPTGELFEEGSKAEQFGLIFNDLRTKALPPAMSEALIREILQE